MNDKTETAEQKAQATPPPHIEVEEREYEQSGLYPSTGKSFRVVALLGFLAAVIAFLAIAAYALDRILI